MPRSRTKPTFYQYPVALWTDALGGVTGCTLDGEPLAVYDRSQANVMRQIKKTLQWRARRQGRLEEAKFVASEVRDCTVSLRPSYESVGLRYPGSKQFDLRVTCIFGTRGDMVKMIAAPTLGVRLVYGAGIDEKELIAEAVRQKLAHQSPENVAKELKPPKMWFASIQVRVDARGESADESSSLPALTATAEPIVRRGNEKRWPRAWNRDDEVQDVAARLSTGRAPLLLVGPSGIGKTTIIANAIRSLVRGEKVAKKKGDEPTATTSWRDRAWLTSGSRLVAGMQYLGQWEERCESIVAELSRVQGVLCVENLLELVRAGGRDPASGLGAFFLRYLQRGELRIIAECTSEELDACRRLLPALADAFEVITIQPMNATNSRQVLELVLQSFARESRLEFEAGVPDWILQHYRRFCPYVVFPGRIVGFTRELGEETLVRRESKITVDRAREKFQHETGLPDILLRDEIPLERDDVRRHFATAVVAQPQAADVAASTITSFKAGLNDPQRPIGVLFFCGPTGVGKTEMAKAIARWLFGHGTSADALTSDRPLKERLVRLDMSEYGEPGASSRLVQQADGEVSDFVKRMRLQPFSVVLLDEIEKASADVHDALLGLLDEGRLTDRFGRVTNFTSSLIIMTSNVGADRPPQLGFGGESSSSYLRELANAFRPEFLNRIDNVVAFQHLDATAVKQLVARELRHVAQRERLRSSELALTWTDAAVDRIVSTGFHPRYGARPMQRVVEQEVVAVISRWIVEHPHAQKRVIELDWSEERSFFVGEQS